MFAKALLLVLSIQYINAGNLYYSRGGYSSAGAPAYAYGRSYEVSAPAGGWSAGGGDDGGWVEGPPHGHYGGHGHGHGIGHGLLHAGSQVVSSLVRIPSRIIGLVRNTLSGLRGSRGWGAPAMYESNGGWGEEPQRIVAYSRPAIVHSGAPVVHQSAWEGYGNGGSSSGGSGWDSGASDGGEVTVVGDGGNVWDNSQVVSGDDMAAWSGYGNGGGSVSVDDSSSSVSGGYGAPAIVSGSAIPNSDSAVIVETPSSGHHVEAPVEVPTRVIETHRQVFRVHNTDSHEHKVHEHNHQTQKVRETHEHQRIINRQNLHRHNLRNIIVHQKNTHQHVVHEHHLNRHNVHLTKVVQPVIHNYEQQKTRVVQSHQHQTRVIPNFQRLVQTHAAQDVQASPVVYNHPVVKLAEEHSPAIHVAHAAPVAVSHNIGTLSSGHGGHSGHHVVSSGHGPSSSHSESSSDSAGGYSNQVDKVVEKN